MLTLDSHRTARDTAPEQAARAAAEPARTTGPVPTSAQRTALWDNARLIVILLVVFGHLIETIRGTPAVDLLYGAIYAFHMPAFMLACGFFASSDRLSAKRLAGTAQLLVTWLVIEFGWAGIRALTGDNPFPHDFLVVQKWAAWFLVSLFTMRVLLPYLAVLPHPLVIAAVVSLGAGLLAGVGREFSMARTLGLLPFFVLGWALKQWGWHRQAWFVSPSRWLRLAAVGVLAAAVAVVALLVFSPGFTYELLFWRRSYSAMNLAPLTGLLLRAGMLVLAAAMTLAFLLLTPRQGRWYTRLGENTLYVYVLHIPIITALDRWQVDDLIARTPFSAAVALAIAVTLTLVLSLPIVKRATHLLIEPRWVFKRALEGRPAH